MKTAKKKRTASKPTAAFKRAQENQRLKQIALMRAIEVKAITRKKRETDKYYIHPESIPSGKSYQWFAHSILGEENEGLDYAKAKGWRSVPFARHDFNRRYNINGEIIVDFSILMENDESVVKDSLEEVRKNAQVMLDESPVKSSSSYMRGVPIADSSFIVSSHYDRVASDSPPVQVNMTISFRVEAAWQDAASALGLTNEEYARRRVLMQMPLLAATNVGGEVVYEEVKLEVIYSARF